ncbi:unnamed protein product [Brassica oleracea var. botrytis]|uniref:Uncharacterized protein n=2 Tax=Brassica TaxID=3705 RepID=A0A3P6BMT5_BRAOL|nr:unnamed protein product [Brassica napus]VDD03856.1 unnamed protein product [Brassica oleracea]VDD10169.1 unnamed protein product [Brassica oleracea]
MMASTLSRLFSRSRPILLRRVSFRSCFPKHTLASSLGSVLEWMNINGYNGRGLVDLPRKHPLAAGAAKIPNDGSPYYNRQSLLHYQKLQEHHTKSSSRILKEVSRQISTGKRRGVT